MADKKIGHIQVSTKTAEDFKDFRKIHAEVSQLGKVTNDQFMRLLLVEWQAQLVASEQQMKDIDTTLDYLRFEQEKYDKLTPEQLEYMRIDPSKNEHLIKQLENLKKVSERFKDRLHAVKTESDTPMPVTLGFSFGERVYAWMELTKFFEEIPNPEEYFIAPSATWDATEKKWRIDGYSFVHVSHLPDAEQLREKMYRTTHDERYKQEPQQ